jgi:Predicted amidophosphoribosyltransferases
MIFLDSAIDGSDDLYTLGNYYPLNDPEFKKDEFSKRLLAIKYRHDSDPDPQRWKQRKKTLALRRLIHDVNRLLSPNIAVAVVPSHDPAAGISGIQQLAQALAKQSRIDATACLVRYRRISKLATGGSRSVEQHLNSIRVEHAEIIQGQEVLLLDDVTTSGNSLIACRQLLLGAGATRVKYMALGQTTHSQ